MYVDWSEPGSVIKFIGVIILVIVLVFGAIFLFSEKNWKSIIEVTCEVKSDSIWFSLSRKETLLHNNFIDIISVTLKITPTSGEPFEYVFDVGESIYYEETKEYTFTFEELFEGKSNQVKTVKSFKVTNVELKEAGKN